MIPIARLHWRIAATRSIQRHHDLIRFYAANDTRFMGK